MTEGGMNNYKYDIAISFAGEQREYVKSLASRMTQCGLKVFYDDWESMELWGDDLTKYLSKVYREDALFTLPVFSEQYNEKMWPQFEFEQMQEREYSEDYYILPISFDGSFPDNWPNTRGFISSQNYTIDEIAILVRDKVRSKKRNYTKAHIDLDTTKETQRMTVTNNNGVAEYVEVIIAFKFKDDSKEFVIYTKNEKDAHGNITVYISEVKRDDSGAHLDQVEDKDWFKVKEAIWELSMTDEDDVIKMPLTPFLDSEGIEIL